MRIKRKKFKLTRLQCSALVCFIGVFITGSIIRYGIYSSDYLQKYSPLMFIGFILIYLYSRGKNKNLSKKKYDKSTLIIYSLLIVYCFVIPATQGEFQKYLQSNIFLIAPMAITAFRYRDSDEFVDTLRLWVLFLRLCVVIMFCGMLIDAIFHMAVTKELAEFSGIASLSRMYQQGRCVSYMGHSLFSAELYLIYFCFEYILCVADRKKIKILHIIIPLVGTALTQGRATFLLLLIAIVLLNFQKGKIRNLLLFSICLLFVYEVGIFNGIIDRVTAGLVNHDLSSGRNTSIQTLISAGELNIKWFGGNIGYDENASLLNMALEYPIVGWASSYGIIGAVLIIVLLFIYPMKIIIFRKQKNLIVIGLCMMLCVNSYVGLSTCGMQPYIYYIALCMLLNTSNYFKKATDVNLERINAKEKIII